MNGPLKMYLSKPIVRNDLPVELPSCMYKMKNIHAVRNGTVIADTGHVSTTKENLDTFDQVILFLKKNQPLPEMATLVVRQEQILQQLADLKNQMLILKENLTNSVQPSQNTSSATNTPYINFDSTDIVINMNPLYPSYSLKVLQKLWRELVNLHIESYLHSTISKLPEQTELFVKELQSFVPTSGTPQLTIRIIWKEVGPHPELVVSSIPILGEVNILRYLARQTSTLTYETANPFELDSVLDTCYSLIQSKNKTNRSTYLHVLNKKLGKSEWLCGRSNFTIADIGAYSALKQISQTEINVNLVKWLQKCDDVFC